MNFKSLLLVATFGFTASPLLLASEGAWAKEKSAAAKTNKKGAKAGPGALDKKVQLSPKGLDFGLSMDALTKLYDKVLEEEYLPQFKKAEPGRETEVLEDEMKRKQGAFRRSKVDFGNLPTGVDQTPLKGEYSYGNGESMAKFPSKTGTRYFFFFNDKLWKIYDEFKLEEGGKWGENYEEAVKSLSKKFAVAPKKVTTDSGAVENQWQDPEKVIRLIDRGSVLGFVYADKHISENLDKYRRNKPADLNALDKDVAAVTQNPPDDPTKAKVVEPKDAKGKGKDKPKK